MKIDIRKGRREDAPLIARQNSRLAFESEGIELDPETVLAGVNGVFDDPSRGFYLIAESSGTVVGQLLVTYEWDTLNNAWIWWITSVYVPKEHRRLGVFRKLYDAVLERAGAGENVSRVELYVDASNRPAQKTYENLGMTLSRDHYYEVEFDSE